MVVDEKLKPLGVSVRRAANLLDCAESTVRRLLKDGELQGFLVSGKLKVSYADLERYARSRRYPVGRIARDRILARTNKRPIIRARRASRGE